MRTAFSQIDLTRLQPPDAVETLDFEAIHQGMLADLRRLMPEFSALTEADPAYKIIEVAAYREMILRARINAATRATMLAYARGTDLDQIAGNYAVTRLVRDPGNPNTIPPTPLVYETDDELRERVTLSLEGYSTAGARGAYEFHALSASGDVLDVGVRNLQPGTVGVSVLSRTGNGAPSAETLRAVQDALNAEDVRPLCDTVQVTGARVAEYRIEAVLTVYPGAGADEVQALATAAAQGYAQAQRRLGRDVTRSGIFAALHGAGVQNVRLVQPAQDVVIGWDQAAYCTAVAVTIGGVDD